MELRPLYPVLSDRTALRPLGPGDVGALVAYRSRPDVCRYVPFEPMDADAVAARLAGPWAGTALDTEGQSLTLGVTLRSTGELVGDVLLA